MRSSVVENLQFSSVPDYYVSLAGDIKIHRKFLILDLQTLQFLATLQIVQIDPDLAWPFVVWASFHKLSCQKMASNPYAGQVNPP